MQLPLTLRFRFLTLGQRVDVVDANGTPLCHVLQKAFRLKEDVVVHEGSQQGAVLYRMRADRILDIGARYTITDASGAAVGSVRQRGMRSLWRSTYDVLDERDEPVALVTEENPWVALLDGLIGEIPFVGLLLTLLVNPAYRVEAPPGTPSLRILKRRSLLERSFVVDRVGEVPARLERLLLPSVLMVVLLERRQG
ncbi:MAG TPA: hypothetical protein VFM93_08405 [Candidatus Limnocylindria bacterium]|nr:hypothetical protein [Candidatus Limnocylindria bacterium]